MKITIINGPNLNLLGSRETDVYGDQNFDTFFKSLKLKYPEITLEYYQSNIEGELINFIQKSKESSGIVINAAAYTHTSVGIADAIKAIDTKVIEVHISNTFSREEFRHNSYLSPVVDGIIIGFGLNSYELAIKSFLA
tara:strand:- start:1368 stop:1781 length:414 start_codon:yes stop_codon:yes gene_type:complete